MINLHDVHCKQVLASESVISNVDLLARRHEPQG
ncbi:hypothetical protein Dd703_0686 [Musicola paradisiaca Ech703]|uniref:Uncharacterized protein n=1 Tax=Musicola paradisiaca (strain Ech703) TaxID=579405 RepID=C6CA22_MUSP7|nr:hypothetical protein Dd703_0686 [Musicola paradisiaca Ech703]